MLKEKYSCAIVGGGLGGVVMASMLALYDIDVLLVEKNDTLGGCITDYPVKDYTFSHSIDWFSGLHERGKVRYWLYKIGLLDELKFSELEAFKRVVSKDYNICFYSDWDKFTQELITNFPHEEEGILQFITLVRSFGEARWFSLFYPFRDKTFVDLMNFYFKDEGLITILSANLNDDMSAYLYILFLNRCLSKEVYLPLDKTLRDFFHVIEEKLMDLGVTIIKEKVVEKIGMENGLAASIELKDGRKFFVDGVITDIDLKLVYNQLLPSNAVNNYYLNKLNARHTSSSLITTCVGVKKQFDGICQYGEPIVYVPTYDREDKYSLNPEKWHVKVNIKSLCQPFLSPEGKSVIDIRTFSPEGCFPLNKQESNYRLNKEYLQDKKYLEEQLLQLSEKVLGSYRDCIEYKRTATPYTFARYTNGENGSAMGWAVEPLSYVNGFWILSPIKNLFHVGCWASFPGIEGVVNYCLTVLPRIIRYYGKA